MRIMERERCGNREREKKVVTQGEMHGEWRGIARNKRKNKMK